jgi:uncharacterized membrane protein YbhN (UPF0104 family)
VESDAGAQPPTGGVDQEVQGSPRWHRILQGAAICLILLGVVAAVSLQHATISEGLRQFGRIRWRWVVAAGLSELISMVGLALLYRDFLRANQFRLRVQWIMACCFTSNAIALSVPVIGSGIASRRTFRRFRQGGADSATASFALTVGTGAVSLSPTPGGIGAVEVAMVAALAAFDVRGPDAVLGVLVYRLTTFKIAGSLWAVAYEYLDRHQRPLVHPGGGATQ